MSRSNIVLILPSEDGSVVVTFRMKNGGTRKYRYTGMDAIAVLNGSDPADLQGERIG